MEHLGETFGQAVQDIRALRPRDMVMFVLRHAESLGQKEQKAYKTYGDQNIPLTALGVQQANATGVILQMLIEQGNIRDVELCSSTGHRATRTMVELNKWLEQGRSLKFDARLDKQRFGDFDGLFTSKERAAACPETFPIFQKEKEERGIFFARPPNGESIEDVQKRMIPFFQERKAIGGTTIVVTHGTNALCLEDIALNRGVKWIVDRLDTRPNCAIRMITGNDADGYAAKTICTDPIAMIQDVRKANGFDMGYGPQLTV